jgi:hypothetical protein
VLVAGFACAAPASPQGPLRDGASLAPPTLVPSSSNLATVLARHESTRGRATAAEIEDWEIDGSRLHATSRVVFAGDDFMETVRVGTISDRYGLYQGQGWLQNENGETVLLQDVRASDRVGAADLDADVDDDDEPELAGETSGAEPCYVVAALTADGDRDWFFYDKASGLLVRRERDDGETSDVYTYRDFRSAGGRTRAWNVHVRDGRPEDAFDYELTADSAATSATPALEVPPNARRVDEFPDGESRVALPARFAGSDVIIRLDVAGRALDFALDSGASSIVIASSVAADLGLRPDGESRVVLPAVRAGVLALHALVASTEPLRYQTADGVPLAGLLGFDFFDDAVIHVDYQRHLVTAIAPQDFQPDMPGAIAVRIELDDQVPMVRALLGDVPGERFIVDSGADELYLFDALVRSPGSAVRDEPGAPVVLRRFPYLFDGDADGATELLQTEVPDFTFAGIDFRDLLAYRVVPSRPAPPIDADGLIGSRLLRYYDVYFDYPHARLVLVRTVHSSSTSKSPAPTREPTGVSTARTTPSIGA